MGNVGSIVNMFKKIGAQSIVTRDFKQIESADKILLPGVGSFDKAMKEINDLGLNEILDQQVRLEKKKLLGICLGMQLLTRGSEEGNLPGLGWIQADTKRFPEQENLRVPHMGWNKVVPSTESGLTGGLPIESKFYFVHSYFVKVDIEANSILKCNYGVNFDAAVQDGNIYGAQFHPEKSHKFGMQLLKNFVNI